MVANVRLYETVYLQIEQGLLDPNALETLGWTYFLSSTLLARMWPEIRPVVTPAFAAYLDGEQPELGAF